MSALDSDQLIATALKKLGNETITEDAQIWLANILDRLYADYKWPFLEAISTGSLLVGQQEVDLPENFIAPWDVDSLVLIDSAGSYHTLEFFTQYDFDRVPNPVLQGSPKTALLDLTQLVWKPYPLANQAYTWKLRYRIGIEREADPTSTFTPVFPNDQILIQAIFVEGLMHEDDDRYPAQLAILDRMIMRFMGTFNKHANKLQTVRYSSKFSRPGVFR